MSGRGKSSGWGCGAAAVGALLLAAGCTGVSPPPQSPKPSPLSETGTLGVLDSAYDRSQWRWVKNPDGRSLLSHVTVPKCFVDPDPGQDFGAPDFVLKREQKTIGKTRYDILNVFEGRQFWMAVYQPAGAREPWLGVYSEGRCREEAERILQAYEKK